MMISTTLGICLIWATFSSAALPSVQKTSSDWRYTFPVPAYQLTYPPKSLRVHLNNNHQDFIFQGKPRYPKPLRKWNGDQSPLQSWNGLYPDDGVKDGNVLPHENEMIMDHQEELTSNHEPKHSLRNILILKWVSIILFCIFGLFAKAKAAIGLIFFVVMKPILLMALALLLKSLPALLDKKSSKCIIYYFKNNSVNVKGLTG